MNPKKIFSAFAIGSAVLAAYGCDQSKPKCSTGHGDFAAKYTLVDGPAKPCGDLKGDVLGVQTYNAEGENSKPNLNVATVAIGTASLGSLVDNAALASLSDPNPDHHAYALGQFAESEPNGDFCTVPSLAAAVQELPAVKKDADLGTSDQPATKQTYQWSNVKVYVTALAYGTQLSADLTTTIDGTTCSYKVLAMYPNVDCHKLGADGNPVDPPEPDDALCAAAADPEHNRPTGSGINPDFPVACDPDLFQCFLTKDTIPALK